VKNNINLHLSDVLTGPEKQRIFDSVVFRGSSKIQQTVGLRIFGSCDTSRSFKFQISKSKNNADFGWVCKDNLFSIYDECIPLILSLTQ